MADDIEFGGAEEMTEEELPEGINPVDVDAVDEVDDSDAVVDDIEDPLAKPNPLDEEEKSEDDVDIEEASYFFDEDKGFDAR